jgi:hypothetical protein
MMAAAMITLPTKIAACFAFMLKLRSVLHS